MHYFRNGKWKMVGKYRDFTGGLILMGGLPRLKNSQKWKFFKSNFNVRHFKLAYHFLLWFGHAPNIWVSWALLTFGFITALSSFLIIEISLAPSVGCYPSQDFYEKKIIQAQKGIARDVLILECERNNKDGLSSFQAQTTMINKLWPHLVW